MKKAVFNYVMLVVLSFVGAMSFTSCEKIKELLETPEYPDEDFSIVGTWEYQIPPCVGTSPLEGQVYNATGYITFTADEQFSFVLNSDNGLVKGYGTYEYDEDSGISLYYASYKEIEIEGREEGYIHTIIDGYREYISWGNEGDLMEDDYMKVHTSPMEYHRVESQPFEETVMAYRVPSAALDDDWHLVSHSGSSFLEVPDEYVKLKNLKDENN